MYDRLDIYNMALVPLGIEMVQSEQDTTLQKSLAENIYPVCLRRLQATGWFEFCNHHVKLTTPAPQPPADWKYPYHFDLPAGTLRVHQVMETPDSPPSRDWAATGTTTSGTLLSCGFTPAYTILSQSDEVVVNFPELFCEAVAAAMSMELAIPLTKDKDLFVARQAEYIRKVNEARGYSFGHQQRIDSRPSRILSARY